MTVQDIELQVLVGTRAVHKPTSTLSPKFAAVGVGTLALSDNGGLLDLGGAGLGNFTLAAGKIFIGDNTNTAKPVVMGGDATISSAGVLTISAGAITVPKLSSGLQTELSDHESRVTALELVATTLVSAVTALQSNTPAQEIQTSTAGQTVVTLTSLTFNASNAVLDIDLYIDGRLQTLDVSGGSTYAYHKTSTTTLLLSEAIPAGKQIMVLKRGTSTGPNAAMAAPGTDLTAITVDPKPSVAGNHSLGSANFPWKSLFIKDKSTSQVYELEIVNGGISFTPI